MNRKLTSLTSAVIQGTAGAYTLSPLSESGHTPRLSRCVCILRGKGDPTLNGVDGVEWREIGKAECLREQVWGETKLISNLASYYMCSDIYTSQVGSIRKEIL